MKCPHCGEVFDPREGTIGVIERDYLKREIYEQEVRDRYESMKDKPKLAADRTGLYLKGQRAVGKFGALAWPAAWIGLSIFVSLWFVIVVPIAFAAWLAACALNYVNDRDYVKWVEEHPEAARFRPPPSFERR